MLKKLRVNSNLELNAFEVNDAKVLFELIEKNRTYLREWLPWLDHTKSISDSELFIEFTKKEQLEKTGMVFGIWQNNKLVGVCSYQKINSGNRTANIGYWISKDESGKGLAKAVTNQLIEVAFTELNIHRIEIRCALENIASQKVAESCGLLIEGISRQCEWLYDHFVDHKVYSILRTDAEIISF